MSSTREHHCIRTGKCQSSFSLALRSTAAPGQQVGLGTGFARAEGITPLRRQCVSQVGLGSARWAVAHGHQPNPSVNRTSNSGLRPLSAAGYFKR